MSFQTQSVGSAQQIYSDRAFDFFSLGKLLVKACAPLGMGPTLPGPIEAIGLMLLGTESSQFRVEKTKTDAVILLSDGESVRGYFFVAHASPRSSGPELVGELLNAEAGFFPFELHDDKSGAQTVLYNRHHVVTVALADAEARRDPGYEVARQRFVSVLLSNGARISGSVRVYRPEGRDRLSDWARQAEVFRYIETDTVTMLVNVAHIIEVKETPVDA
jgi:hypothetical protein